MKSSNLLRLALAALALSAAACSSTPKKDSGNDKSEQDKPLMPANPFRADSEKDLAAKERKLDAEGLYKQARLALDASDFSTAISRYNQIATRFPFTEYATQADLERVYALYRSFQQDDALAAADKFLKEHPRHPAADYIQYLKGLINTSRDEGLSGTLGLDNTKEDVSYLRRSFDDFSLLAQKYPNSRYAGDARQHMIDLRNRIAQHDLHIVHYYVKRGAFIAAAKRAEQILLQYPGAPATVEAMQILEKCYRQMGVSEQADEVHKILVAQQAVPTPRTDYPVPPQKPGFFTRVKEMFVSSKAPAEAEPAPMVVPVVSPAMPTAAAPVIAPAPDQATQKSDKSWLHQLFTPGDKAAEGATIVIPSSSGKTEGAAATAGSDSATGKDTGAAAPAKDSPVRGDGFSITMEPYDKDYDRKLDEKAAAEKAAPAAAASSATPAPPAPAAAQEPAEAPTFSNWFHHLFSSDKKPAAAAAAPTTDGKSSSSEKATSPAADNNAADKKETPTLMDLLYHSVAPDKETPADANPAASKSDAPEDPQDSKPATTSP